MKKVALGFAGLLLFLSATAGAFKAYWTFGEGAPEFATGRRTIEPVTTQNAMVVSAHPLATAAGVEILKAGGSALDAAIAVQTVLTLVEPQSSGIGGGAFLLHYDRAKKKLEAYDGRETAPAAVDERLFLHEDGTPYRAMQAIPGGRSVGVPGVLRALELAHGDHGRLPWKTLFAPAIALSEQGFEITPRLSQLLHKNSVLRTMASAREHFYTADDRAKAPGTRLINAELAKTLRTIAEGGADAFYRGPLASDIVKAVREAKRPTALEAHINLALLQSGAPRGAGFEADDPSPGFLSEDDLANYQAKRREPLCRPYRAWRVCGFAPPSSGGVAVLQVLALLERFKPGEYAVNAPETLHRLAEAERLAFADRDRYLGDADVVAVPVRGLLDSTYLGERSALIGEAAAQKAAPGVPPDAQARASAESPERPATSHFSIVDARGNVVSMTTSIEYAFGSQLMVGGFLLNNQLTDFSFRPGTPEAPVANAVAPGKRPRSSMAPVIVFDLKTGEPVLALGSPGGSPIIGYVARSLLAMLDWGLTPQQAVELPHAVNRNGATELENEGWAAGELESVTQALTQRGHRVEIGEKNSGLHAIALTPQGLVAGVDPRREGLAAGW